MRPRLAGLFASVIAVSAITPHAHAGGREPSSDATGRYTSAFHLLSKVPGPVSTARFDEGFTRDRHGVTYAIVATSTGYAFAMHAPGMAGWPERALPDGGDPGEGARLALGPAGTRLYLAMRPCLPVVMSTSTAHPHFDDASPETRVARRCDSEGDCCTNWEIRDLVGLPHGQVAVLLNKPGTDEVGRDGIYVSIGRPGHAFTRTRLGDSVTSDQPLFLARDASTGALYVGSGTMEFFTHQPGHRWRGPTELPMPASQVTTLTALTAMHGHVWAAFQHSSRSPSGPARPAAPADGVLVAHTNNSETWSTAARLPGSDDNALQLRLSADPVRHVIHAIYTDSDYFNRETTSGLYHVLHTAGTGWQQPQQLTHWWHDAVLHITVGDPGYTYDFRRS